SPSSGPGLAPSVETVQPAPGSASQTSVLCVDGRSFPRRLSRRLAETKILAGFWRTYPGERASRGDEGGFEAGLRSGQLPNRSARQLPDQSTTLPPQVIRAFSATR